MIDAIAKIFDRCDTNEPVLPPTALYNENWMLRLVLDWLDRNRKVGHPLSFTDEKVRWFSEALLPSYFRPKSRKDSNGEAYTHADGIIGHFKIGSAGRGDACLLPDARQFVVTEAKMGSKLSGGVRHAPDWDQAVRTVACMAQMLFEARISPDSVDCLAFYVIAPESQINAGVFGNLVSKESIEEKVKTRFDKNGVKPDEWFDKFFMPMLKHMKIGILSWESVLFGLPKTDESDLMHEFYKQCKRFNLRQQKNSITI
jgi:hypothetical protein